MSDESAGLVKSVGEEEKHGDHAVRHGLIAKTHCDLSENRIIESVSINEDALNTSSEMNYDEMVSTFLDRPGFKGDRVKIADILKRENLINRSLCGDNHFTFSYRIQNEIFRF